MPNKKLVIYIYFKILNFKNPNKESTKYPILFFINKINLIPFINYFINKTVIL